MDILGYVEIPGWILAFCILSVALLLYSIRCQSLWSRLHIPGPTPIPFVGINRSYAKKGIAGTDIELTQKYGRVVGIYQGNVPALLVTDPDIIKYITVKDFGHFTDRFLLFPHSKLFQESLFHLEGDHWKFVRTTLSPTFSSGKMRKMVPLVQKCIDTLLKNVQEKSKYGQSLDMKEMFSAFTMDVICSTAFGLEVDSQNNKDDPFVRYAKEALTISLNQPIIILLFMFPMLKHVFRLVKISRMPAGVLDFFDKVTISAIEERKKDTVKRNDFLQLMITANKERNIAKEIGDSSSNNNQTKGLTFDEIRSNALFFFIAGYDTTATTLSFASYCLATNPVWQDRLIEEIDTQLGNEAADYDNVMKLTNLDMFVSEVLRLYNPTTRFGRKSDVDYIVNGIYIPKGIDVSVPIHGLHRDPEFWPDPDKFDPLRFSKENKEKRNPYTYLPFGSGPRICIGTRLAQLEIRMVLVSLLRVFKFEITQETEIPPVIEHGVLARAKNGIKLKVQMRC